MISVKDSHSFTVRIDSDIEPKGRTLNGTIVEFYSFVQKETEKNLFFE